MATTNTSEITVSEKSFLQEVKTIIESGRQAAYGAVNAAMIQTYWKIGQRIVEEEQKGADRAEYGTNLIKSLSSVLTRDYGKGFSERALAYYRQFYLTFNDLEILHTRVQNLTWSHLRALMRVDNEAARNWYLNEASSEQWSVRTLDRNISSQYYFRLLQSQHKEPVEAEMKQLTAGYQNDKLEFIKNPVVAEFLGLSSNLDYNESALEQSIITHIQKFLLEMGKGYAFVARQQHIRTELDDYFIDLVFYNFILKCFVLIDLKTTKITHQDIGQMDMYVRMYDDKKRAAEDNPTLGIILCTETDADVAKYSVLSENKQLFAAKYLTYLPSEDELRREIERQKEIFQIQQGEKK